MAAFPGTVTIACPGCGAGIGVPVTLVPRRRPLGNGLVVDVKAGEIKHTCRK